MPDAGKTSEDMLQHACTPAPQARAHADGMGQARSRHQCRTACSSAGCMPPLNAQPPYARTACNAQLTAACTHTAHAQLAARKRAKLARSSTGSTGKAQASEAVH
mmetsp:Transcript_18986/g.48207  ORF Transcript_18986/g.48207 Transcript_18986/m.48207 type:complete len:105 (+) Transcript_18986:431-745(+)